MFQAPAARKPVTPPATAPVKKAGEGPSMMTIAPPPREAPAKPVAAPPREIPATPVAKPKKPTESAPVATSMKKSVDLDTLILTYRQRWTQQLEADIAKKAEQLSKMGIFATFSYDAPMTEDWVKLQAARDGLDPALVPLILARLGIKTAAAAPPRSEPGPPIAAPSQPKPPDAQDLPGRRVAAPSQPKPPDIQDLPGRRAAPIAGPSQPEWQYIYDLPGMPGGVWQGQAQKPVMVDYPWGITLRPQETGLGLQVKGGAGQKVLPTGVGIREILPGGIQVLDLNDYLNRQFRQGAGGGLLAQPGEGLKVDRQGVEPRQVAQLPQSQPLGRMLPPGSSVDIAIMEGQGVMQPVPPAVKAGEGGSQPVPGVQVQPAPVVPQSPPVKPPTPVASTRVVQQPGVPAPPPASKPAPPASSPGKPPESQGPGLPPDPGAPGAGKTIAEPENPADTYERYRATRRQEVLQPGHGRTMLGADGIDIAVASGQKGKSEWLTRQEYNDLVDQLHGISLDNMSMEYFKKSDPGGFVRVSDYAGAVSSMIQTAKDYMAYLDSPQGFRQLEARLQQQLAHLANVDRGIPPPGWGFSSAPDSGAKMRAMVQGWVKEAQDNLNRNKKIYTEYQQSLPKLTVIRDRLQAAEAAGQPSDFNRVGKNIAIAQGLIPWDGSYKFPPPTVYMAEFTGDKVGIPYWGSGTKDDPYYTFADRNSAAYKQVLQQITAAASSPTKPTKIYGKGTKDDPFRDYPDLNNPPFQVAGKGTKDDPFRAAPKEATPAKDTVPSQAVPTPYDDAIKEYEGYVAYQEKNLKYTRDQGLPDNYVSTVEKTLANDRAKLEEVQELKRKYLEGLGTTPGADYGGRTYTQGARIIADDGVEYTATGGQWLAGRKLDIGEKFTDIAGDQRIWDGAGGKLVSDWQQQQAVNQQYEAYRDLDWQRNISDQSFMKGVEKAANDRTRLMDALQTMQRNLRDKDVDGFKTGDAARLEGKLDEMINDLLGKGQVDDRQVQQIKNYYWGLQTGRIAGSDRGPRDDLSWVVDGGQRILREAVTGTDDEGKFSWSAMGLRMGVGALTLGQSETLYISGQNFYTAKDWVDQGGDEQPGSWGTWGLVGRMGLESGLQIGMGLASERLMGAGLPIANDLAKELAPGAYDFARNFLAGAYRFGQTPVSQVPGALWQAGSNLLKQGFTGGTEAGLKTAASAEVKAVVKNVAGNAKDSQLAQNYFTQVGKDAQDIIASVKAGKDLTPDQMLRVMKDPATRRYLNDFIQRNSGLGMSGLKVDKAFNAGMDDIARGANDFVKGKLELGHLGQEVKVGTFRTPKPAGGAAGKGPDIQGVNTDMDVFATRTGLDGVRREIDPKLWGSNYHQGIAQSTGVLKDGKFDLGMAKKYFPGIKWEGLPQEAQVRVWSEMLGVEPNWKFGQTAAVDFSKQPTAVLKRGVDGKMTGPTTANLPQSGYAEAVAGKGALRDAEQLGVMEGGKVKDFWNPEQKIQNTLREMGVPESTVKEFKLSEADKLPFKQEALEQLRKQGEALSNLMEGYSKTHQVPPLADKVKQGMDVVKIKALSPGEREAALIQLGFKGGVPEFNDALSSQIGSLKIALPKAGVQLPPGSVRAVGGAAGAAAGKKSRSR
jgi:hypothetical protein